MKYIQAVNTLFSVVMGLEDIQTKIILMVIVQ